MYSSTSKSAHREGETTQGSSWFRELYGYFASARQEILECGYTEEEINDAIDEAVAAVRERDENRS